MNTSTNSHATFHARLEGGRMVLRLPTGLEMRFPIAGNPRLAKASEQSLLNIEVSPYGVHWPDLDEDLSFAGLATGQYGQRQSSAC